MQSVLRITGILIAIGACLALAISGTAPNIPTASSVRPNAPVIGDIGDVSFWGKFILYLLAIIGGLLLAVFAGKKR